MAKSEQNFADVKHGDIVAEPTILPQPVKELATGTILENHVDKAVVLEWSFEWVDEGMVELHEYFLFELDVLDLFEIDDMAFGKLL